MLRPSRFLALSVVLLSVVTAAVLQPSAALAATSTLYGAKFAFSSDSGLTFNGIGVSASCNGGGFWVGRKSATTAVWSLKFSARCTQTLVAGLADGERSITVHGLTDSGSSCTRRATVNGVRGSINTWSEGGEVVLGSETVPGIPGGPIVDLMPGLVPGVCNPFRINSTHSFGNSGSWSAPLSVGPRPVFDVAPAPGTTCEFGTPISYETGLVDPRPAYEGYPMSRITWLPVAYGMWAGQAVYLRSSDTPTSPLVGSYNVRQTPLNIATEADAFLGQSTFTHTTTPTVDSGIQFYRKGSYGGESVAFFATRNAGPPVHNVSQNRLEFTAGTNDPSRCIFYFGPKLWDDGAAGGVDEPGGQVTVGEYAPPVVEEPVLDDVPAPPPNPDPTVPDEECQFTLSDPGSWLSGGMCSTVGLLGRLVALVFDLLNAVLGVPQAILDGVAAAFVPDGAVLAGSAKSISSAWAASSVGLYFGALGSVAGSASFSSSGCAGPELAFNTPFGGSASMHPMSACSGPVATVAGVVKAGLSLGVYVGALLIALRLLGASFGLNLNGVGHDE